MPDETDLVGRWAVHLLAGQLPKVRFMAHSKVIRESDGKIGGHNEFVGAVRTAKFRCNKGRSALDHDLEVMRIAYDVPGNSRLFRPLTDEVRRVGEGKLIGRGVYRFPGGFRRNVFWFSMQRTGS